MNLESDLVNHVFTARTKTTRFKSLTRGLVYFNDEHRSRKFFYFEIEKSIFKNKKT